MAPPPTYDKDLQMFREVHPVDFEKLNFIRWMVERNRFEHTVAGPPEGDFKTMYKPTN